MTDPTISALTTQVLGGTALLAFLFGWVASRTHFCTMGALSDAFNMGDHTRLRMWVLAVAVATFGFHGLAAIGWINPSQTLYTGVRVPWLATMTGGLLFGVGMVLASGCGAKTLIRVGAGSLRSLVVALVMAVSALATLKGVVAVVRVDVFEPWALVLPSAGGLAVWLGSVLGVDAFAVALVWCFALLAWVLAHPSGRQALTWLAGVGVGACVVGLWWLTGRVGFLSEHPETLEPAYLATQSGMMEAFTFTAPLAHALDWLTYFSDASNTLTVGVVAVFGVVLGSAVDALCTRRFHWEGFVGAQDTALHLLGAALMGVGGVMAMGCTIGQGLSGLSTMGVTSFLATAGLVAGGWLGMRIQLWLVMRD
jgi:hypothetical protein